MDKYLEKAIADIESEIYHLHSKHNVGEQDPVVRGLMKAIKILQNPNSNETGSVKSKVIAIDFDGTCVTHEFPSIGPSIGAEPVLNRLVKAGHRLILNTMRSGGHLDDAVRWFNEREIPLWGVQYNPTQVKWTTSNKCYAELYIDDAALGCPLIYPEKARPYVDWPAVEDYLESNGYLDTNTTIIQK